MQKKGWAALLVAVLSLNVFSACGQEEYIKTDKNAYALVDNYFSYTQKTQYSGASITQIEITANKDGFLEIGKTSIKQLNGTQAQAYAVKKGKNVITLQEPLALSAQETLLLGGGKTDVRLLKETDIDQTDGKIAVLSNQALSSNFTTEEYTLHVDVQATYTWQGQAVDAVEYGKCLGKENLSVALSGLQLSIMGDSISTFEGWSNNPEANTSIANNKVTYPCAEIPDLDAVEKTYWKMIAERYGMDVLVNNAYGGSKVSIASSAKSAASMTRAQNLHDNVGEKANTKPDVIFAYIGTNDIAGSYMRCGTFTDLTDIYKNGEYVVGANFDFAPAYAMMLHKMQAAYPEAKIFCFTTWYNLRHVSTEERKTEFDQAIRDVATYFGAEIVDLARDSGIAREDFFTYADDGLHPNTAGMQVIARIIENVLIESYR